MQILIKDLFIFSIFAFRSGQYSPLASALSVENFTQNQLSGSISRFTLEMYLVLSYIFDDLVKSFTRLKNRKQRIKTESSNDPEFFLENLDNN